MDDGSGAQISDSGPFADHGLFRGSDPQWIHPEASVETLDFDSCRTAKAVDVAVTALVHFGVDIRAEWNLDGVKSGSPAESGCRPPRRPRTGLARPAGKLPEPFNSGTEILFSIPQSGRTTLTIFDSLGREVTTLADGVLPAGRHRLSLSGERMSSGIYILRLAGSRLSINKKY